MLVAVAGGVVRADIEADVTTVDVLPPLYPYNSPVVGDVTGDGIDDVVHPVIVDLGPSTYTVAVFAGNASGGLDAGVTTPYPPNTDTTALAVGDMDGDGRDDLVQFERSCTSTFCWDDRPEPDWNLTVRSGNADGTFGPPAIVATQVFTTSIELADLDADGDLDIASQTLVGDQTPTGWWPNDGGTFGPFESFNAPYGSVDGVGQFGGGPAEDVLLRVENSGGGFPFSWVVVLGPGTQPVSQVVTDLGPGGAVRSIADVDGDGDDDVLYLQFGSSWQWTLRLSDGNGGFGPAVAVGPSVGDSDAVLANVDGTGRHDVVFFDAGNAVTVIDPEGIEPPDLVAQVGQRLVSPAVVGNFDGIGLDDVIRYSYGQSVVPDAFKIFRFPTPNPDADGDGILDAVDADGGTGTAPGAFGDESVNGTIVSVPAGWSVLISDAPAPDGVRVVVEGVAGTDRVTLSVCGFTLKLSAGSDAVLTCGSVVAAVAAGTVEVELGGGFGVVRIPEGSKAEVDTSDEGGYAVDVLQGSVAVSVDGVDRTIDANDPSVTIRTWKFVGFERPVDGGVTVNRMKAGRAVPLKWRLLDETGAPVLDLPSAKLTFQRTSCDASLVDIVEEALTVGSGLQNHGDGSYQLNWKTPSTKGCGTLQLDVGDGVLHTARFQLT
jgi:hypothetical protein